MSALACGCDPDCKPKPYYREDCEVHGIRKAAEEPTRDQLLIRDELAKDMRLQPGPGFGKPGPVSYVGDGQRTRVITGIDLAAGKDITVIKCNACEFETGDINEALKHVKAHGWGAMRWGPI